MRAMSRFPREFSAIPLMVAILGFLGLLFLAFQVGAWAWILLGVFTLVALGVLAWWYAARHPHPAAAAASEVGRPDDGVFRILVVADVDCPPESLREGLAGRAAGKTTRAYVVAPALSSRLDRWTGDEKAYGAAQQHLAATIEALGSIGVEAEGRIASHDPVQAADDGLREFPADLIVFATRSAGESNRLERDAVDAARERYSIPVLEV